MQVVRLTAEYHPTQDEWVYYAIWEGVHGKLTEQISYEKWVNMGSEHPSNWHTLSNQKDPDGLDPWSREELRMEQVGEYEEEYEEENDE